MKFKVGDKVRVIKSLDFPGMVGNIYEVLTVEPPDSTFVCRVIDTKRGDGWNPLM